MIKTAVQLKDLVRNLARSTGIPNYILLRRYMMERFLERLAQTHYRNSFILKGGMLISDMVGVESRATKDIDATVAGLPLTEECEPGAGAKGPALPHRPPLLCGSWHGGNAHRP